MGPFQWKMNSHTKIPTNSKQCHLIKGFKIEEKKVSVITPHPPLAIDRAMSVRFSCDCDINGRCEFCSIELVPNVYCTSSQTLVLLFLDPVPSSKSSISLFSLSSKPPSNQINIEFFIERGSGRKLQQKGRNM